MANEVRVIVSAQDKTGPVFTKMRATVAGFAAVAGAALVKFGIDSIKAYRESYKIGQQTNAVLKSTGQVAGISAKGVEKLATAISNKTGIDDEAIQSGENLLLTFTNIRNEAGKGNQIFTQATKVITDMSVALGQDMKSSAIQVGKALNDPIKGVTALQRVGVSFTESQKNQIKSLEKSGHHLEAQKIILHELKKEFGGSAEAAATWGDKLKVAFGNAQENLGKKLMPAVEHLSKWLTKKGVPAMEDFIASIDEQQIADAADNVGTLAKGLGKAALAAEKFNKAMKTDKKGQKMGGNLKEASQEWALWKAKALDALDTVLAALAKLSPMMYGKASKAVHAMRVSADKDLGKMQAEFNQTKHKAELMANSINQQKIKAKVKADIKDLESKVRDAKKRLRETNDQKTQAKIKAEIRDLQAKVRAAKSALHSIRPVNIPISAYISRGFDHALAVARQRAGRGIPIRAQGGPVSHAAEGGPRGDMVLVGERGPEVVQLPGGSHVFPNGNTAGMSKGGRGGDVHFHFHGPVYGDHNALKQSLVTMKRRGELDVVLR